MRNIINTIKMVENLSPSLGGVFNYNDLALSFGISISNKDKFKRIIKILLAENILFRFCRGIYITNNYNIETLSEKIDPTSYISCETVLAKNCIIGPIRNNDITAISMRTRPCCFENDLGKIRYLSTKKDFLKFGVNSSNTYKEANIEKAFIDTLYYYNKGVSFNFNIYQDINIDLLDKARVIKYLENYSNKSFKKFVRGILND